MKWRNSLVLMFATCFLTSATPAQGFQSIVGNTRIQQVKEWVTKNGLSLSLALLGGILGNDHAFDIVNRYKKAVVMDEISYQKAVITFFGQLTTLEGKNNSELNTLAHTFLSRHKELSPEQQHAVALGFLTTCKNAECETKALVIPFLATEKERFIRELVDNKELDTNHWQVANAFYSVPVEKRAEYAELFFAVAFDKLTTTLRCSLIQHCRDKTKWGTLTARQHPLLAPFLNEAKQNRGPLFCRDFFSKNISKILSCVADTTDKVTHGKTITEQATAFATEEYEKGNIVLFHGQSDHWAFLEKIFNCLRAIKDSTATIPIDFVRFRFQEKHVISNQEAVEIRAKGTNWRPKQGVAPIIFTNLHLLEPTADSSALCYALKNGDCSGYSFGNKIDILRTLCTDLGFEKEYHALLSKDPEFFNKLYELYKKEVSARGNIGRLIAISLPKEKAKKLCYTTYWTGYLIEKKIGNKTTDDIITIAQNYSQIDFIDENCLILAPEITDPELAKKVGITMKTFTSAPTEESLKYAQEFEAVFKKVIDEIAHLYQIRTGEKSLQKLAIEGA